MLSQFVLVWLILLGFGLFVTASATSWFGESPHHHRFDPKISVVTMQGTNVNGVIQSQLQNMFAHEREQHRKHTVMKEAENDKERKTIFVLYFSIFGVAFVFHLLALLRRRQLVAMKKERKKKQDTKMVMTSSPSSLMTANAMEEDDEKDDDDDDKSFWGLLVKDKIFEEEN